MQAMRRYAHKIMAALLCMCLLISYAPLPALAESPGASVGADGSAQMIGPNQAQATTTVSVLTVQGLAIVGKTDDFAAKREQIAANGAKYDLKVMAVGQAPLKYRWTRTIDGAADAAFSYESDNDGTYPLSQNTNTLQHGKVYVYTVQVSDATKTVSASIKVTVSSSYEQRTFTEGDISVAAEAHWQAVLSSAALDASSPTYALLQAEAGGKTMAGAWQIALTGAPQGLDPFTGQATVTLPAGGIPDGSDALVVCLGTSGTPTTQTVKVTSGKAIFQTATLGAFALAWEKPVASYTITATAGLGGSITPSGAVEIAEGGMASFTILADEGYAVQEVLVDGTAAEALGGQYVFSNVRADHTIAVAFRLVPPDPQRHQVSARVEGGHGKVGLNGGALGQTAQLEVEQGVAVQVALAADEGYVVDAITVDTGQGPQTVPVMGDVYTLAAVQANTEVVVSYKPGAQPPLPLYTVSATASAGGSVTPSSSEVPLGGSATFTVVADPGYRLVSLTLNSADVMDRLDGSTLRVENVVVDGQLHAEFEKIPVVATYAIAASASSGGTMSPSGQVAVREGDSATFVFEADDGCELARVLVDGRVLSASEAALGSYTFSAVAAHHTIRAEFQAIQEKPVEPSYVVVHASAGAGGTISPSGDVRVVRNADCSFMLLPSEGYVLDTVTVDGKDATSKVQDGFRLVLDAADADCNVYATFRLQQPSEPDPVIPEVHAVSASSTTGGTISPRGTTQVPHQSDITFMTTADEGYRLARLEVDGAEVQPASSGSHTLYQVKESHRVRAVFERVEGGSAPEEPPYANVDVEVKVNVSAGGGEMLGGTVSPTSVTVPRGSVSTPFYVFPEAGFDLDRISVNGVAVEAHRLGEAEASSFALKARASVFAPANSGASGGYWFVVDSVQNDAIIEVTFKPLTEGEPAPEPVQVHRVEASATAGGRVSPAGATAVPDGMSASFAVVPDAGFQLVALRVEQGGQSRDALGEMADGMLTLAGVTEDARVQAVFAPVPPPLTYVTVKASADEGGKISPAGDVRVLRGQDQTFSFVPNEGYVLDQVTLNGKKLQVEGYSCTLSALSADASLHATFREAGGGEPAVPAFFDVTSSATAGGRVSPSGVTSVESGKSLLFSFIANKDCELVEVTLDGAAVPKAQWESGFYRLENVQSAHELAAIFGPKQVDPPAPAKVVVTATAGDHGAISPAGQVMVDKGSSVEFALLPDEGYEVDEVLVNKQATAFTGTSFTLLNVQANTSVQVSFRAKETPAPPDPQPKMFTVSASVSGGHGRVSPDGAVRVEQGKAQVFYFLPDAGYTVSALVIDGQRQTYRASAYRVEDVQADRELVVEFTPAVAPAPANPFDSASRTWQQATGFVKTGDANGPLVLLALAAAGAAAGCALFARRRVHGAAPRGGSDARAVAKRLRARAGRL